MPREIIDLDRLTEEEIAAPASWKDLRKGDRVKLSLTGEVVEVFQKAKPFPTILIRRKEVGLVQLFPDQDGSTFEILFRSGYQHI